MQGLKRQILEDEADSAAIAEMAERAIRFARESNTLLTPESFHVWFVYASRRSPAVNEALDKALNTGARLTRASIAELHQAHIAGRSLTEELSAFSDSLAGTMADVSGAVTQNLDEAGIAASELRLVKRSLGFNASRHELMVAVGSLMKANQSQLDSARKLETQLERSRSKIAALEKDLAEARKTASVDHLTKLPNRRRFDLLLGEAIFNARQRSQPLSLAIADLDSFAPVNAKFGHATGDNVLRYFAGHLTANLKGKDVVARYGGEEFAVLLADAALADIRVVSEKLRQSFAEINWTSQQTGDEIGSITVSFGVTTLLPADTRESFIARAEALLQEAKKAGKNQTRSG